MSLEYPSVFTVSHLGAVMETRKPKDARVSEQCQSRRSEEGPFNKCLSCFRGIDEGLGNISYAEFNTGCSGATRVDVLGEEEADAACKHIDVDDCWCKQRAACVGGEAPANFNIFSLTGKETHTPTPLANYCDCQIGRQICDREIRTLKRCFPRENSYSEWPVKLRDQPCVCGDYLFWTSETDTFQEESNISAVSSCFKHPCDPAFASPSHFSNCHIVDIAQDEDINVLECKSIEHVEDHGHDTPSCELDRVFNTSAVCHSTARSPSEYEKNSHISSVVFHHQSLCCSASPSYCNYKLLLGRHESAISANLHRVYFRFLPVTETTMKPAKIGQLTPISYRSRPIDRSECASAGVQVVPTAQQAWLCGRDGGLFVVGDVSGASDHREGVVGPVIATRCNTNVACCLGHATLPDSETKTSRPGTQQPIRARSNSPRESQLSKGDYFSDSHQEKVPTQSSTFLFECIDVEEQANDKSAESIDEWKTHIPTGSNIEGPFIASFGNNQKLDNLNEIHDSATVFDEEHIHTSHSPVNASLDRDILPYTPKPGTDEESDRLGQNTRRVFSHEFTGCERTLNGDSSLKENSAAYQSDSLTDMSIKDASQSTVYANFIRDSKSISPTEDRDKQACLASSTEQILGVNHLIFHQNRLSHQYLNSAITGQNYPDFLPNAGQGYPYFFTDTGLVSCPDYQFHSNMIFTATATKETSFTEKPHPCEPGPQSIPGQHYYNRNSVFSPLTRETNVVTSQINRQSEDASFSAFPTNAIHKQGNTRDNDLDLMCFPQFSQLPCSKHRSYPLTLPHQQEQPLTFQQHTEHQQLLSHFHPTYRESQQHQHPLQQRSFGRGSVASSILFLRQINCGPRCIRISPVSLLWAFLSVLVAGTSLLSFLTPYWTVHPDHVHSFGLFNLCVRDQRYSHPRPLCMNFGLQNHYTSSAFIAASNRSEGVDRVSSSVDIAKIPSGAWQAACLLYGAGVCVQILGALVSLVVLALGEPWHHRVALINGYMQTVGGKGVFF